MKKDKLKLIFFGDSICVGQYVSAHKTWVTSLMKNKLIKNDGTIGSLYIKSMNDFIEVDRKTRAFDFPACEPAYYKINDIKFFVKRERI